MKKIVVHPGFLENKRHFSRFARYYKNKGYSVIVHSCHSKKKLMPSGDLHVTHSAGVLCAYFESVKSQKLIVAPPLSHHKITRTLNLKIRGDIVWAYINHELKFWAYKTFWSIVAILDTRTWRFLKNNINEYKPDLDEVLSQKHIKVVANTEDPFTEQLCDDVRCISLDGHHDDLLYRPHNYEVHIRQLV